jgi:response regulator RpfG family c-di-GMP phosphodiesterase
MTSPVIRVLIIDDEPLVRGTFVAFMKHWGYVTREAENGKAGLEIFNREPFDIVLTDLDMPVMGGLAVLAYLHEHAPDTPVVIVSGAGQLDDAVQTVKLGAWDYLTKPVESMAILESTIQRCLEKAQLIKENKRYQNYLEEEVEKKTEALRQNNMALRAEIIDRKNKEEEVLRLNRHLEEVVDASGELFSHQTVPELLAGVLERFQHILQGGMQGNHGNDDQVFFRDAFAVTRDGEGMAMICGTGSYAGSEGMQACVAMSPELFRKVGLAFSEGRGGVDGRDALIHMRTVNRAECLFYLECCLPVSETNQRMLQIYVTNVASAYDSIVLNEEIANAQKEVVFTLGEVIETRSKETVNHVRRVAEYSYLLARRFGLGETESDLLRYASPMHDAGKIGIPDSILNKAGELTDEEFRIMQNHTVMGYDILKGSQRPILKAAAIVAHEHHEKWNGSGYPRGLSGEGIHLYGRIVALADVFDALGSDRCYKAAWPIEKILLLIKEERGLHFDPALVDIFFAHLGDFLRIKRQIPDP